MTVFFVKDEINLTFFWKICPNFDLISDKIKSKVIVIRGDRCVLDCNSNLLFITNWNFYF